LEIAEHTLLARVFDTTANGQQHGSGAQIGACVLLKQQQKSVLFCLQFAYILLTS